MNRVFAIFMNRIFLIVLVSIFVVYALPVHAQPIVSPCVTVPSRAPSTSPSNLTQVICLGVGFLSTLVPVIIGLGLVVFLWGLTRFISAGGDEKRIQEGKDMMVYGIIGLFVMVSIYTIVSILFSDFFGGLNFGVPLLKTS